MISIRAFCELKKKRHGIEVKKVNLSPDNFQKIQKKFSGLIVSVSLI